MLEFSHDTIIIFLRNALRITNSALDKSLQASFEQLIDFIIIVIVVPDTEHALYVIPDRPSEARCIDLVVCAHCVIRQIVCGLELVIEEVSDIAVQTIYQGVTMIIPGAVLYAESRYIVQLSALKDRKHHVKRGFRRKKEVRREREDNNTQLLVLLLA